MNLPVMRSARPRALKWIGNEAGVEIGYDEAVFVAAFEYVAEARRNADPSLDVNGVNRAAPEHVHSIVKDWYFYPLLTTS